MDKTMIIRDVPEPHENEGFRDFCVRCNGFLADYDMDIDERLEAIAEAWVRRHPDATKRIGLDPIGENRFGRR